MKSGILMVIAEVEALLRTSGAYGKLLERLRGK